MKGIKNIFKPDRDGSYSICHGFKRAKVKFNKNKCRGNSDSNHH